MFNRLIKKQMKKNLIIIALLFIGLAAIAQTSGTKTPSKIGIAVGGHVSTNGIGAQAAIGLGNTFAIRVIYEDINYALPEPLPLELSGIALNLFPTIKSGGIGGMIDLYLQRDFYLTGGIIQTNLDHSAKLMSAEAMKIGDITWEPEDIGELNLSLKPLEKMAPYLGFGYGRNIARKPGMALSLEIGAYYMKGYDLQLSGTGMFAGNSDNESFTKLIDTINGFEWSGIYPVIKLGLSFRVL
jgi:hypothetical protein